MKYVVTYFVVINILAFWSMYSDKQRAIKKLYRIPEKTLFMFAILGGSLGSIAGMNEFRHKTKHWYFKFGLPLILIIQILLVVLVFKIFN
ncbi:MAG: DUF1294 domain-containing protein [Cellulosilyticaceae bacterium]